MLLPMHIPVLLCGLICGWQWGLYKCLIPAMAAGRTLWGAVMVPLTGLGGSAFTWEMFITGALLNALPGITL